MLSEPDPVIDLLPEERVHKEETVTKAKPVRLSEVIAQYLDYRQRRGFAVATMSVDRQILKRLLKDLGDLQVVNIKPRHIEDWFYGPTGMRSVHRGDHNGGKPLPPISDQTHNQYRSRLAVFFAWMTKRGLLKADLLEDVPFIKVERKDRLQPPPHVLLGLLDSADNARDRAYPAMALNTALRASEIVRITISDVDLDAGYVTVFIKKTKQWDRQPITADLDLELRQWLTIYAEEIGRPLQDEDLLFPSREGGRIAYYRTAEDGTRECVRIPMEWKPRKPMLRTELVVQKALRAAGISQTKGEGTHTIRRAVARAYFDSMGGEVGYDNALRRVSALLHHSNTATTERYLGKKSEIEARDQMLKGKPFLTAMVDTSNVVPLRSVK